MKKLALGCGALVLLAGIAFVGVGYYGYLRVRSTVSQFAELAKVPAIEQGVRIKTPFIAPGSGQLTAAQVDRLMLVQTRVRERLGHNMDALQHQVQGACRQEGHQRHRPAAADGRLSRSRRQLA